MREMGAVVFVMDINDPNDREEINKIHSRSVDLLLFSGVPLMWNFSKVPHVNPEFLHQLIFQITEEYGYDVIENLAFDFPRHQREALKEVVENAARAGQLMKMTPIGEEVDWIN
jgi:hypothetical protein